MKKDKLISFRVPESVYDGIRSLAEKQGTSVSQLMKDTIASASWSFELERNREYHRQVLRELDRVEKRLAKMKAGGSRLIRSKVKA
jgi:hypothetical protein